MNLLISKIPNKNKPINFKKDIRIPIDYDSQKGIFKANYEPLDINIESRTGSNIINLFTKKFINLYEKRNFLKTQYTNHFNQIVK
jgi:hypothetical protein